MKAKAMKDVLEQEYQMLKLTLEVLANDNVKLKNDLAELSNNVKKNKLQLQDYLNTITDKDTAVSNLNKKIEMLHIRLSEINKIPPSATCVFVQFSKEDCYTEYETRIIRVNKKYLNKFTKRLQEE